MYHYFRGNETGSTSVFEGLKEEVGHLPKKVLIVFEDLERVNQEDAVKKSWLFPSFWLEIQSG